MKRLLSLMMSVSLFSCMEVKVDDLKEFVVESESKIYPINDKMPTLSKIDKLTFISGKNRDPFSEPKAEVIGIAEDSPRSCRQPDLDRKKETLEMYATENILMRGTFLIDDELWGLVQVPSGKIHKLQRGYYLGLNYGEVLKVTQNGIELLELVSNGSGCWEEHVTQIMQHSE